MNDRSHPPRLKLTLPLSLMMPLVLLVFVAGITWWSFHLGRIEATETDTREALSFFALTSLMAVGLGLFFHLAVARRLKRLARVAQQFGSGTPVPSGIGGSDEVASLAWSIDRMVAEKAAADAQLKESEERYRGLFESTHDLVQSISPEGGFVFVNPQWKTTLGYDDEDLQRMTIFDIIDPDSLEHCRTLFQQVMSGESVTWFEAILVAKDGRKVAVEGNVTPRLSNGKVVATHGFFRDITQRKEGEAVLQERHRSEELEQDLGRIVENSLNEIYIFSAETMRFVQVNRGARENIGYTMDELRELTPADIEPEFTTELLAEFTVPLRSGEQKRLVVETLHQRKDGSLYEAEVHVQITTYQGQPAFVAMVLDITDRKRLEHEIRLQGQALDTGATAITFASLDGRLTYVNRAFRKMWGYTNEEKLLGRPISDLSSSDEDVGEVMKGLREHGEWVGERVAKRKDGSLFEMQVSASMVTSDDGEPIAMMASFVDISDLKRVEASLARLNEELEQRAEERSRQLRDTQQQLVRKEKLATLGQLAGTVAHEIRNPLAIIKNAAYFLDGEKGGDQDTRDAFGEINRALYSSNRIVSELLDYARDPKLETTDFPPDEVVNRALSDVPIPDNILVDSDLGESNFRLRRDAGQVERMLINLIQNAIQAMSQGGNLTIRCRQLTDGQAEIEVKDTGHGIEQNDLQRVFEPLYSSKVKGIGLGLALCKRYAELNQGRLSVESELEVGSTFRLTLPCVSPP